tara:strand:+ start:205 stop:342 length:138 start_codon:yes stop_codon:yes gene_type:complete
MEKTNYKRAKYKSIGKLGMNNLASRLLMAVLPPKKPFFKVKEGAD